MKYLECEYIQYINDPKITESKTKIIENVIDMNSGNDRCQERKQREGAQ